MGRARINLTYATIMKTLLLGFLIGVCASATAWLVASDINERFDRMAARLDRHEQAITVLVGIASK